MADVPNLGILALAEMHRRDQELGIDPLLFDNPPPPPAPPPQRLGFPEPDWAEEERLRREAQQERERQEREWIVRKELARLTDDDQPPEPLPKRRGWKRREAP